MLTSQRQRENPVDVPRPWDTEEPSSGVATTAVAPVTTTSNGGWVATGLEGMIAVSKMGTGVGPA